MKLSWRAGAFVILALPIVPGALADASPESVSFPSGQVELQGELLIPAGSGPHPAIVYLHGSGCGTREDMRPIASELAARGYAGLLMDKRGCGASQGNWQTASLDDLAADAESSLQFLSRRSGIDASRIGLWAISQSGWSAPIAANRSALARFLVVVTGGGATPEAVERYGYAGRLTHGGFSLAKLPEAEKLLRDYFRFLGGKLERDNLLRSIGAVAQSPWYRFMDLGRVLPAAADREAWSWVATYDPLPDIGKLRVPALVLLGAKDLHTPLQETAEAWNKGLKQSGIAQSQTVIFGQAGHGLTIGGHQQPGGQEQQYVAEFLPTVYAWLESIQRSN